MPDQSQQQRMSLRWEVLLPRLPSVWAHRVAMPATLLSRLHHRQLLQLVTTLSSDDPEASTARHLQALPPAMQESPAPQDRTRRLYSRFWKARPVSREAR